MKKSLTQDLAEVFNNHESGNLLGIKSYVLAEWVVSMITRLALLMSYKAQDHG